MEAILKSNYRKLREIFMYYDSEPIELLQSFLWLFLITPISIIESGFSLLIHLPMVSLAVIQLYVVLNSSLNVRKIVSFVMFLVTIAITTNYFFHETFYLSVSFFVFLFNVFFTFFNLKRLTIEKIKKG